MFESIVFVAMVVILLAIWFAFWPVFGQAVQLAWRLNAMPGTFEAIPWTAEQHAAFGPNALRRLGGVVFGTRFLIVSAIVGVLAWANMHSWVNEGYAAYSLWPHVAMGNAVPDVSSWLAWLVKLAMFGLGIWVIPRACLGLAVAPFLLPATWKPTGLRAMIEQVVDSRRWFLVSGATVAFLAAFTACFASVFEKDIGSLQPVLRDNFWLVSHVMTITSSYCAAAVAWVLGNISLAWFLFGPYRDPRQPSSSRQVGGRDAAPPAAVAATARPTIRPSEFCDMLGEDIYVIIQVAVVLLAAGTVLGALWADVAWGRFWGWDSKEVWALISLLVYLAVLHGRFVGWFGSFGLAIGAVLGGDAVLLAWYGVNYIFGSGLHTYGAGAGDNTPLFVIMGANIVFAAAASIRYLGMTRASADAQTPRT
jgi:ABC-type transport system involved in cytochrome c biogenesis permease subunit